MCQRNQDKNINKFYLILMSKRDCHTKIYKICSLNVVNAIHKTRQ